MRETLRPIFQLSESSLQKNVPSPGSSSHSATVHDLQPNSTMPTITPDGQHNTTLYTQNTVNQHETLPTNEQQDILATQLELDWSLNQSNLDFFNTCMVSTAHPLPLSFLHDQVPEGLGLSSNCQIWLDKLNITNWDEFVHVAGTQTSKKI